MKTPQAAFRVLVIDDTPSIHDDFRKILVPPVTNTRIAGLASAIFGASTSPSAPSYTLDSALQGQEGLALVEKSLATSQPYALAFVDMRIPPGWDGLETIAHIRQIDTAMQIVICTAYSDHSWSAITERIGTSDNILILKKPFDHVEVLQLAHALCQKWQLARDNTATMRGLDELVQKRTAELAEAEERFSRAFNASPLPQTIISLDPPSFLDFNKAFERLLGLDRSTIASHCPDRMVPQGLSWDRFIETIRQGGVIDDHPFTLAGKEGRVLHMRCSARPVSIKGRTHAIVVIRDVTDQIDAEQRLRQSQKLEAIGQLSAGIAHDFNNLLTVIHGYTSELLASHPDSETRQMLEPMQTATTRAASLVRQLLIFSRKEVIQPQLIDLAITVNGLRQLLRRLIESTVTIEWSVADRLPLVFADPANLEQVLVNLVINARDAMPRGGTVSIKVAPCNIDGATAAREPGAKPGPYVAISVADTGTGIPDDALPHIFEPFFTTKEVGKGTGLGLSTVYSIAKQHGGWIHVDTAVGRGTTFTFYQPVPEAAVVANAAGGTSSPFARRRQIPRPHNVLVAEDSPAVHAELSGAFTRRHIKFSIASDGPAALALWMNSPTPFDLLIASLSMPDGFNGIHLARTFREQNPRLPVILTSDQDNPAPDASGLRLPGPPPIILPKPFTLEQLRIAVIDCLSQPS